MYGNIMSWNPASNTVKLSRGYNSSPTQSRRVSDVGQQSAHSNEKNAKSRRASDIGQQSASSNEKNAKSRRASDTGPRSNVGSTNSPFSGSVTDHRRKSSIAIDQRHIADLLADGFGRTKSDKSMEGNPSSGNIGNTTTVKLRISSGSAFYCNVVEQQQLHTTNYCRARVKEIKRVYTAPAERSRMRLFHANWSFQDRAMWLVILCCQICIFVCLYGRFAW